MTPATHAPVLLVTGATKGIGLATALAALDAGYRVAATSRDAAGLRAAVTTALTERGDDAAALVGPDRFLPLTLSFAPDAVASSARAVAEAVGERWGADRRAGQQRRLRRARRLPGHDPGPGARQL